MAAFRTIWATDDDKAAGGGIPDDDEEPGAPGGAGERGAMGGETVDGGAGVPGTELPRRVC